MRISTTGLRIGAIVGAVLVAGIWFLSGGSFVPGSEPSIVIEFGADPESLEGTTVEIDGTPAGKLERHGAATRSAFQVAKGDHTVRLAHPSFDCDPLPLSLPLAAQKVFLIAEYAETIGASGRPQVMLRR